MCYEKFVYDTCGHSLRTRCVEIKQRRDCECPRIVIIRVDPGSCNKCLDPQYRDFLEERDRTLIRARDAIKITPPSTVVFNKTREDETQEDGVRLPSSTHSSDGFISQDPGAGEPSQAVDDQEPLIATDTAKDSRSPSTATTDFEQISEHQTDDEQDAGAPLPECPQGWPNVLGPVQRVHPTTMTSRAFGERPDTRDGARNGMLSIFNWRQDGPSHNISDEQYEDIMSRSGRPGFQTVPRKSRFREHFW